MTVRNDLFEIQYSTWGLVERWKGGGVEVLVKKKKKNLFLLFFFSSRKSVLSVRTPHHSALCGSVDHSILNIDLLACQQTACKSEAEVCQMRWYRSRAFCFEVLNVIWLSLENMMSHAEKHTLHWFVLLASPEPADCGIPMRGSNRICIKSTRMKIFESMHCIPMMFVWHNNRLRWGKYYLHIQIYSCINNFWILFFEVCNPLLFCGVRKYT